MRNKKIRKRQKVSIALRSGMLLPIGVVTRSHKNISISNEILKGLGPSLAQIPNAEIVGAIRTAVWLEGLKDQ